MWVQHPVYNKYIVSFSGNVRHIDSVKNRAFRMDRDGYLRFNITFSGRHITLRVHTMVADCFIVNDLRLPTVNHIDGDKLNNSANNLEWMSAEDNTSDSYSRPHKKCHPIIVDGVDFRSKRQAERVTGISRFQLKG